MTPMTIAATTPVISDASSSRLITDFITRRRSGFGISTTGAVETSTPVVKNSRGLKPKALATSTDGKTATAVFSLSTVSL